ncbi:hypothetical protein PUNSTDRAFT_135667 [Punctularia strigosozonata HHB-11173 SS5]|uniref:uncharacterized protein n=1 Tax=Punctularia strigosozonata (strain HHB-11173) TaxID=741275 RepID=UPI000441624F|nr:uncharacterized protein PUNSTDRAFT_135667 [Punctularia strigosozonata HHB-11173 SS5]EIN06967.1 hypothetical protein PUNSTDRAFT_135667 [Punctularia strigosozonata HHB-11173 SS5]
MPSDAILALATGPDTVTSVLARDPTRDIDKVAEQLFPPKVVGGKHSKEAKRALKGHEDYSDLDLARAEKCGKFPYKPSELFLKIYSDVLDTLERNPLIGVVSPPLLGSSGVVTLSIVSTIPDIMRHYKHLIVNCRFEVMLATNFWQESYASSFVHDALIELSQRYIADPSKYRSKPVVKFIYDRGSPKQVFQNHLHIKPEEWAGLGLPKPEEIPGIEFEAMNYHRPIAGTFHAKYMVVDRRIAVLNSNNIQDNANVEMMAQFEGPIVESFYDMSLISWAKASSVPLPLISGPFAPATDFKFGRENPAVEYVFVPPSEGGVAGQWQAPDKIKNTPITAEDFKPHIIHEPHSPVPMAMVNRHPHGTPGHEDVDVPQNVAWLAGFRLAQKSVFIQTPDFNAKPVVEACLDACKRDVVCTLYLCLGYNDSGEMLPMQGGTNSKVVIDMYTALNKEGKGHNLKVYWYTAKDQHTPIDAAKKDRNCHIKYACFDDQVAIMGNGNQDTQSWFHSQEINVMVDSPQICKEWYEGINHNQNTRQDGLLDEKDGLYRDKEGQVVQSAAGTASGPTALLKGIKGTIDRVRGVGGTGGA